MTTPDDLSDRELELAELGSSDEDVEALLSGGADIDDLIAAGVLEVDEPTTDEEEDAKLNAEVEAAMARMEAEVSALSAEEVMAQIQTTNEWLEAKGHRRTHART